MQKGLADCELFKNMERRDIERIMSIYPYAVATYAKSEVIALKDSRYTSLMIVADGSVSAETTDRQDNTLKADRITAPSIIAPTILFAENNRLPVNIYARSASATIVSINSNDLCSIMSESLDVMKNFLEIVSSPGRYISENVVYLTFKTIKGKFANYLLDQIEKAGNTSFHNSLTQREMADIFGVTRPALARAIGELVDEGTIYVNGKNINVLFTEKLKHYAKY